MQNFHMHSLHLGIVNAPSCFEEFNKYINNIKYNFDYCGNCPLR
jgi:hypothetical protein